MKKIIFKNIPWEQPTDGVRQKVFLKGNQKLRLLEFSEGFVEKDWCTKGHVGYVLEGSMRIDFNGEVLTYKEGNALWMEEGVGGRHKVLMGVGDRVLLILFETIL